MTYKIDQIEGIGATFGQQLMNVGVHTSDDLLARGGTPDTMRQLELATGITSAKLSTWMRQADLMRISGIGPEFGQLLEQSGIESVMQLSKRDPENIAHLVARVNEAKGLTRALPAASAVALWIAQAKEMATAINESTAAIEPDVMTAPADMANSPRGTMPNADNADTMKNVDRVHANAPHAKEEEMAIR